ncbi:MAG TPA: bifunctional 2-polyprenyl-6-hydroxyphenol methylase/3-demethylubiquinol 3-O-methyltransferase UbiG [Polyangiaceae bacterium]|jgi:2-polyprenyl-6-hydroxyphenyl methylase/3-demethylubiquinone-9 3-methyltransferase|nr:bifunctional 2-polyprenyl-6-hydroxyphenol methylase/3-demethylubiquinol 3-O-methyltransferase UbiG [Polyangiaceae bacterium]
MVAIADARPVNNDLYDTLGDRWYDANDDPVALLRAESRLRNPWVDATIQAHLGPRARVLDIGCGGGFLSNALARAGHAVTGLDASADSLAVAARRDETGSVRYERGDALALPYEPGSFDAVCAMDFLEHVEAPARAVAEAARVLRPGGLFFFHTFNRNPLAWLVVIKGVEWLVKNTPPDMHVLRLFVKPSELRAMCEENELVVSGLHGSAPVFWSRAFWTMVTTGTVPPDFRFAFVKSTAIAYTGVARKR